MSGGQFKKFVTEEEVNERRQQRQTEWERTRQPDDPEKCPEEESRSLFEQLKANSDTKERELEDENKLRSTVKVLEDDEVQFLNYVSNRQMQIEKERLNEEKTIFKEMKDAAVIKIEDKAKDKKSVSSSSSSSSSSGANMSASGTASSKKSQQQLLMGAIKTKRKSEEGDADEAKKRKSSETDPEEAPDAKLMAGMPKNRQTVMCAGILPGISGYDDDDSSTENTSNSSDSEADHTVIPATVTQRVIQEMVQKLKNNCS